MQLLPAYQPVMQPPDLNKVFQDAAQRKIVAAQAAVIKDYLDKQLLAMDLKNRIDAPKASHAEEITLADLMKTRSEAAASSAQAREGNVRANFLPALMSAQAALYGAQARNDRYSNPTLKSLSELSRFTNDNSIDPNLRGSFLSNMGFGQPDNTTGLNPQMPSPLSGGMAPYGQGSSPNQSPTGNQAPYNPFLGQLPPGTSPLQAFLMPKEALSANLDIYKKNEESKNKDWQSLLNDSFTRSMNAVQMGQDSDEFIKNYRLARKGLIPGVGALGFISNDPDNPIKSIFANPYAQVAMTAANRVMAKYGALEIPSGTGKGISTAGLRIAGLSKPNIGFQPQAAESTSRVVKKSADIHGAEYHFLKALKDRGFSTSDARLMWQKFVLQKYKEAEKIFEEQ